MTRRSLTTRTPRASKNRSAWCLRVFVVIFMLVLLAPDSAAADNSAPNDPRYAEQYALQLLGANCAWTHTIGNADVIVAVVDSGVDLAHPDLVGRLRPDGYDFVDNDNDPSDQNGHGTNVAGIIAMTLDNNEGGVGLAPGVSILPVRVMNRVGYGSDQAIASGIRFAADKNAKVINLSLGATLTISAQSPSELVISAIRYAQDHGALVVVAAGNDFVPLPNAIVGENPDVLVVAATDQIDRKAAFSNSGPWISVTAPGIHILSTMPTYPVYLTSTDLPADERFKPDYDFMSGTSQATPFVSALAALLFSAHPDWTAAQVAQAIKEHAVNIAAQNVELTQRGYLGSGRISACDSFEGPSVEPTLALPTTAAPSTTATVQVASVPTNASSARSIALFWPAVFCVAALVVLGGTMILARRSVAHGHSQQTYTTSAPVTLPAPVTAPVPHAADAWGALTIVGGPAQPRSFPLRYAETIIGRAPECTVAIAGDATLSRRHALVRNNGDTVTVEDLGSTHGTTLRGLRVSDAVMVRRGDIVQLGQTLIRFD